MSKRLLPSALLAALVLAGACEDDQGPGYLAASLEGPIPLGAAVVDVRGTGILGFEPAASTRVYSAVTPDGVHRVVLVAEAPSDLLFRIKVEDPSGVPPTAVLVSAADGANLPVTSVTPFRVNVTR